MQNKITIFLSRYRITPQSTTGEAPSVLLMNKVLRSRLDLLKPSVKDRVVCTQDKQQNKHAKNRVFEQGDTIFIRNFSKGKLWLPGFISEKNGPVSYKIKLADGCIASRHQDHIRLRFSEDDTCDMEENIHIENSPLIKPNIVEAEQTKQQTNTSETLDASSSNSSQPEIIDTEQMEKTITESAPIVRRSTREQKKNT